MVRCQIIMETMEAERLVDNAATVGKALLAALEQLANDFPNHLRNVRGRGLFCAFDCSDAAARQRLLDEALKNHVLLLPCGQSAVRMRPALTLTRDEALEGVERIRRSLNG